MASVVLTNCKVVAGSDISAYVQGIVLNYEAEAVKETRMGNTTEVNKGGVKKWGGTIQFKQDYADNLVDEIVFALIGTTGTFQARPDATAAISTSNPEYNGTALFTGYAPISGQHGELSKSALTFVSAGDLDRDVTP
jgi:hypothetical protein